MLKRALAIREKTWRPTHPEVALSLNELAGLYLKQARFAESEALCSRAVAILEGPPLTQPSALARCWDLQARIKAQTDHDNEAEALFQRALAIREENRIGDCPGTVEILDHYANLLRKGGRTSEAESIEDRSDELKAKFGRSSPSRGNGE